MSLSTCSPPPAPGTDARVGDRVFIAVRAAGVTGVVARWQSGGMDRHALGDYLRSRREHLDPGAFGADPLGRRTPGLRRSEISELATVSEVHYANIEQGRGSKPSPGVLAVITRAMRLTRQETEHVFALAGEVAPHPPAPDIALSERTRLLLHSVGNLPALVCSARFDVVGHNDAQRRSRGPSRRTHHGSCETAEPGEAALPSRRRGRVLGCTESRLVLALRRSRPSRRRHPLPQGPRHEPLGRRSAGAQRGVPTGLGARTCRTAGWRRTRPSPGVHRRSGGTLRRDSHP